MLLQWKSRSLTIQVPIQRPPQATGRSYVAMVTTEEVHVGCLNWKVSISVVHGEQKAELPLKVISGSGLSLLGRNWLSKLD